MPILALSAMETATVPAPSLPAAKRTRRPPRWLIPAVLAVTATIAFFAHRLYTRSRPYVLSGTMEARTISIGSKVGGRVERIFVREGQRVQPGQPLVQLEEGDLAAQRLEAEGKLAQAEAQLRLLLRGTRKEEVARGEARERAARVTLQQAELDARRARNLLRSGAITRSELDSAETALKNARAQHEEATAALEELQRGSRVEEIQAQRGAVDAARGRLEAVNVALGELTIIAPRPAVVETFDLRPGDLLAPGATAATLVEEDALYLRLFIPETLLGKLQVGDAVEIKVDSFPQRRFPGVVESISSVGEYTPRNLQTPDERAHQVFAARIGLRDGRDELRAGMAAFVAVPR